MYPGACCKDVCCIARPFIWRGEVWLGHWIGFLPAQERMALARLDMDAGVVNYEYRFSHLPEEVEAAQHPDTAQDIQTGAAPLLAPALCAQLHCTVHCQVRYASLAPGSMISACINKPDAKFCRRWTASYRPKEAGALHFRGPGCFARRCNALAR